MAVRVALGETQLVQEVRRFLIDHGVSLDSFSQVSAHCLLASRSAPGAQGLGFQVGDVLVVLRTQPSKDGAY